MTRGGRSSRTAGSTRPRPTTSRARGSRAGSSRGLTLVNFPIALVAIALALVAMAALPARGVVGGGPRDRAVRDDSVVRRPGRPRRALGQRDPGARRRSSRSPSPLRRRAAPGQRFAPRRPWDGWRLAVAVVVVLLSLPWIAAELGFHFPGDFFMGEELGRERDGTPIAAVHLGHHHGTDGALLVLTALLLSRVAIEQRGASDRRRSPTSGRCSPTAASTSRRTLWNEQIVKRGWTDAGIPSALLPGVKPIWARRHPARRRRDVRAAPGRQAHVILRPMTRRDGLPRLREVRARRQDLRARADHRRRSWGRPAHARLDRGRLGAARRVADRAHDPPRHGPRGRRLGAAGRRARPRRAACGRGRRGPRRPRRPRDAARASVLAATARPAETEPLF